jgi:hypothetical protein
LHAQAQNEGYRWNWFKTIATGAGWLHTSEDQQRLMAGALTENEKQQAAQFVHRRRRDQFQFW